MRFFAAKGCWNVTCAFSDGHELITEAESLDEAFENARDAAEALSESRKKLAKQLADTELCWRRCQIRSSKSEIRNKFKSAIPNDQNRHRRIGGMAWHRRVGRTMRPAGLRDTFGRRRLRRRQVFHRNASRLGFLSFVIRVCFGFRYSDFGFDSNRHIPAVAQLAGLA
jgi:hypothetical protein